jgi:GH24 family phage-related lysozyme (muramidase)
MLSICLFVSISLTYCVDQSRVPYTPPLQEATEFIIPFEWLALTSYRDTSGRYTIGYWTRSYEWETITKEEAQARLSAVLRQSIARVHKDFPQASRNQIVGLTSVYFNCWGWYKKLKQYGIEYHKTKWFCQLPWYSGLVKRREAERKLLF